MAPPKRGNTMFDVDQFIADCRSARAADRSSGTIGEVVKRAVLDPETLSEQPCDGERARRIFEEANRRYAAGLS